MTSAPQPAKLGSTLYEWLAYIEALHPKAIAMGLERVAQVKQRLRLEPCFPLIIVGGTNGKGSTCAMLECIYQLAGYRVGCYTSPHLLSYNERIRVCGANIQDVDLISAFHAVEAARGDTQLTYFEYGTLAAMVHFMQAGLDVAILEVGLGGRLDAVNAFLPSCAIITSIELDHIEFLGNSRASIGFEKAGIFRSEVPAICGDPSPPNTLLAHAENIGARLSRLGEDFAAQALQHSWQYSSVEHGTLVLPMPGLQGEFQLRNAACVIQCIQTMQAQLPVDQEAIAAGLQQVRLAGRFQAFPGPPLVILDVAHNPHAALALAANLEHGRGKAGKTLAVFGMLADKDISGVMLALGQQIDRWYLASLSNVRGATAQQLAVLLVQQSPDHRFALFENVTSAYQQACLDACENDRIIVLGSFFTVAEVMRSLPLRHGHA